MGGGIFVFVSLILLKMKGIHFLWLGFSCLAVAFLTVVVCQFSFEIVAHIATVAAVIAAFYAAVRSSFDSLFSQLVSSQRGMFSKPSLCLNRTVPVVPRIPYRGSSALYVYGTVYDGFELYLNSKPKVPKGRSGLSALWKDYNMLVGSSYPDFANSFKYIYHEVTTIQERFFMCSKHKREYVKIVQAQMNLNELLCYLFNLIEYEERHTDSTYSRLLKKYDFFSDLYDNVKYKAILEEHIQIPVLAKYLNEYCD